MSDEEEDELSDDEKPPTAKKPKKKGNLKFFEMFSSLTECNVSEV